MENHQKRTRVIVVGPSPQAQGGITAVIENYRKTKFWSTYGCTHFYSTKDLSSTLSKAIYASWRLFIFVINMSKPHRPSAASIHTSHSGSFYRKLAYLLVCRFLRVPAVLHIHPAAFADYYGHGNRGRRWLIRLAGKLSERIVFLSEDILSQFDSIFPYRKLRVLGNPVDIDEYASTINRCPNRRPRILYLGWIVPEKGVYDLIDCIPQIAKEFPDILFTFAGNKEIDKLQRLINARQLSRFAEVVGWVSGTEKLELFQSSTILVLPSYTEGVPNVLLEAMASQLPIVTTRVGGIPSILEANKEARFVTQGDPDSIANGLLDLLRDPAKAEFMAKAAYDRACRQYSIAAIGQGLRDIYSEIETQPRNPSVQEDTSHQ